MNRILYDAAELEGERLRLSDARFVHIRDVLKSAVGDVLRTGEVAGPVSEAKVEAIDGGQVVLAISAGAVPPRPTTDLILALPRPKVLNRLIPQLAALGVNRLILCNASKVERYYFDTHVLDPAHLRAQLIEGMVQCGDPCLPEIRVVKQLRHFLEDEAEGFATEADAWILHPEASHSLAAAERAHEPQVLAIGPEGGWLESELAGFEAKGFQRVSMMNRILRSDTATIAALAMVAMRKDVR